MSINRDLCTLRKEILYTFHIRNIHKLDQPRVQPLPQVQPQPQLPFFPNSDPICEEIRNIQGICVRNIQILIHNIHSSLQG